jgi:hypothetical protein
MLGGRAKKAGELYSNGQFIEALNLYRSLKFETKLSAWDWHIASIEKKMNLERGTYCSFELGSILKTVAGIEKIYVGNLRHRSDRRRRLIMEFSRHGIKNDYYDIFESVHGASDPKALDLFNFFKSADKSLYKSISSVSGDILEADRLNSTPGVIGYLLTQEKIINHAMQNAYKKILVCDDDIFFSDQACHIVNKFFSNIKKWKIVLLGSSEYSPRKDIKINEGYYIPIPFRTCGSFAVMYHHSILEELKSLICEYVGVFDRSILSYFYERYKGECFSLTPPACFADVSDSDIRGNRDMELHAADMRWNIGNRYKDYRGPEI